MEVLGIALLLSVILYLIDKNAAWPKFWRFVKVSSATVVLLGILGGTGYYFYQRHEQRKLEAQWQIVLRDRSASSNDAPKSPDYDALAAKYGGTPQTKPPDTLPANFQGWDKQQPCPVQLDMSTSVPLKGKTGQKKP